MRAPPAPSFAHLTRMSDERGTFEHALFADPRPEHGYCTDDMARLLVVTAREPRPTAETKRLGDLALHFLVDAQGLDGGYRNRLNRRARWEDRPSLEDHWGRAIWGLGTLAARTDDQRARTLALTQLERAARQRSIHPRAMAFAALGVADLLAVRPDHRVARHLLIDVADRLPGVGPDATWPWPQARLEYANAILPEAMIAAGTVLRRPKLQQDGLTLLAWLLARETVDGHLSVTPAGGSSRADARPGFDQQPIEVAALADACARAAAVDPHPRWPKAVRAAAAWFLGDNDAKLAMWDPETGGGYDGLGPSWVNLNQGTESTLALVSTFQQARRLAAPKAPVTR